MSKSPSLNSIQELSLQEAAQLVTLLGENVHVHMMGEPGCGKSSTLAMIAERHGDSWRKVGDQCPKDKYEYIYFDAPTKDIIDLGLPSVTEGTAVYALFDLWKHKDPRPKVVMIDELSKLPNIMKPVVTRLILEHMIGDTPLASGSKTFSTGNMASDGVGDTMQGHINNRITTVTIGKPTADSWIEWALNNKVNEHVIAAVHAMPNVMQSYVDDPKGDNKWIFNPKRNTGAFASPRSLQKAGFICDQLSVLGEELTLEALKGTVGVDFAGTFMARLSLASQLPTWEEIEKNPVKTAVPDSPAAQILLLFGSIPRVDKKNAEAYVSYFYRFETELRMLWARQFRNRLEHVMGVKEFRKTLVEDHWIFS